MAFFKKLGLIAILLAFSCSSDGESDRITGKWEFEAEYKDDVLQPYSFCRPHIDEFFNDGRRVRTAYAWVSPQVTCGAMHAFTDRWEYDQETGHYNFFNNNNIIHDSWSPTFENGKMSYQYNTFDENDDYVTMKYVYHRAN